MVADLLNLIRNTKMEKNSGTEIELSSCNCNRYEIISFPEWQLITFICIGASAVVAQEVEKGALIVEILGSNPTGNKSHLVQTQLEELSSSFSGSQN